MTLTSIYSKTSVTPEWNPVREPIHESYSAVTLHSPFQPLVTTIYLAFSFSGFPYSGYFIERDVCGMWPFVCVYVFFSQLPWGLIYISKTYTVSGPDACFFSCVCFFASFAFIYCNYMGRARSSPSFCRWGLRLREAVLLQVTRLLSGRWDVNVGGLAADSTRIHADHCCPWPLGSVYGVRACFSPNNSVLFSHVDKKWLSDICMYQNWIIASLMDF